MSVFTRKKRFDTTEAGSAGAGTLSLLDLTAYGIAAVVGSGIFATVGRVARNDAGIFAPVSVLIAGGLSLSTAICYLEFASALPVSGSSYAYFYGMVGEVWGWAAGWNLTLEYAFAAAAIAAAWSDGLRTLLQMEWLRAAVPDALFGLDVFDRFRVFPMAAALVVLLGMLVSRGIKLGARLTNAVSALNVMLIVLIIAVGAAFVDTTNWTAEPYIVAAKGWPGIVEGGSHMFFSYIGYDTVSTLSGDARDPSGDVPRAVFLTLAVATALYIGVSLVLTGMQRWDTLAADSSLVRAFEALDGAKWAPLIVSLGSLTTMAATVMACLMGQPKIFRAMADDGLLPEWLAGSDSSSLAFTVLLTAGLALFVNFNDPQCAINDAISFGVLLGMSAICVALLVVRINSTSKDRSAKLPAIISIISFFTGCLVFSFLFNCDFGSWSGELLYGALFVVLVVVPFISLFVLYKRIDPPSLSPAFSCPAMPVLPAIAILANSFVLMTTWKMAIVPFSVWTGLGLLIYFFYGLRNSRLSLNK